MSLISGDVIDGEGTEKVGTILANQPSLVLPALTTKTGKSLTGDSGVTLRIRSVLEDNTLEYRVAPQADSVRKIAVITKPELVLSIEPNYILAGGTFDLKATASQTLIRPIEARVDLYSSVGSIFLAPDSRGVKVITIPVDKTSATLSLTSRDAGISGVDGIITARLLNVTGFIRSDSAPDHSVTIGVLKNYPTVSVTAPAQVREDAGTIAVTLDTGSFRPYANLPIEVTTLTASDTGTPSDYLGTYDFNKAISIGTSGRATIQVPVNHNNQYRGYGEITFTLADGDSYTANTDESSRIAKVIIEEAEPHPTRTISISAPDQVLEGEDIIVMLTNNESLNAGESIDVALKVTPNPEGFYNLADSDTSPITFTATTPGNEQTITIKTNDDDSLTSNGTIDITLLRGFNYEPDNSSPHQVTIVAKEALPQVSISRSTPATIYEADDAVFTIFVTGVQLTQPLPVALTVAQGVSEDFIVDPASTPTSVDVATTGTGKLRIKTIADATQENDGTITVTLAASSTQSYTIGSPATASVTVLDNDDPALHSINISAVSNTAVTEADGAMAMFEITGTGGTSADRQCNCSSN